MTSLREQHVSIVQTSGNAAYRDEDFPAMRLARSSRLVRRSGRALLVLLCVLIPAMFFVPWQQSIRGEGTVIALDPFERPQSVQAPVKGRIDERGEGVEENAFVTKGQLLFRIVNQDPDYLTRLQEQVDLVENEIEVAKTRLEYGKAIKDNNETIVAVTTEELASMTSARDKLMEALDNYVDQAKNKLQGEEKKLDAAKADLDQAKADYERKKILFEKGIESELKLQETEQKFLKAEAYVRVAEQEVESAKSGVEGKINERESYRKEWQAKLNKIDSSRVKAQADLSKAAAEISKNSEEINQKQAKLLDSKSKLAVQQTQDVRAPRDGFVMNLAVFDTSSIVKPGDQLCRIVPKMTTPAVQLMVAGNDAPLISAGRPVRLQFEGWPAIQISGWPSVAAGTFPGEVALVDASDNGQGKFRVVVVPDTELVSEEDAIHRKWPEAPYLRQGGRANGWVLLDTVPLGYEIWRRINGFPPKFDSKEEAEKVKPPKVRVGG